MYERIKKKRDSFTQWNSMQQELLRFTTAWMELESIVLSEISEDVKDKYHMILTYEWNLINKTN